jgi:RNA polymerase sigma-70 factor (ECF subfamily)
MGHPDAELIRRWQQGDTAAVSALVDRWQQPVARFLLRMTGRPDRVPDLCQEVFLRLIRAAPRYRENGRFSNWLFQIALNVARDNGRRHRHEPEPFTEPEDTHMAAPEVCERRETVGLVARAVAELPPQQREVIALRHDQGMTFDEIAEVLGVPASTLKSRFAAALQRLRGRLTALGIEEMQT